MSRTQILSKVSRKLNFPLFVKPPRLGSSIGVQKVRTKSTLADAIDVAVHYDTKVLVEESVENLMDITCCVIGDDKPIASFLQESVFERELFDFEDKYLSGGGAQLGKAKNRIIIPARLDKKTTEDIRNMSIQIFKQLGCGGIARFDFLYNKKTKKFFANEINPLPGTLYHHLWKASGVSLEELLRRLISFAKERHEKRKNITYVFASDILRHAGSTKLGGKVTSL